MGVHHRGLHVAMAEEFLDSSNIVVAFKQVRGKGMAKGVARGPLRQSSLSDRVPHSFLDERFVCVMAALFSGLGVYPPLFLRKDPLDPPNVGIFCPAAVVASANRQANLVKELGLRGRG